MVNPLSVVGRLTADPETRAGQKHESARFRLAVDRGGADGADFIPVVVFDRLAHVVAEPTKGPPRLRRWSAPLLGVDDSRRRETLPTRGHRRQRRLPRPQKDRVPRGGRS